MRECYLCKNPIRKDDTIKIMHFSAIASDEKLSEVAHYDCLVPPMKTLRPYQQAAHDATIKYIKDGGRRGLIVLPTGAGKSFSIAEIVNYINTKHPYSKGLMLTHNKELVEQNFNELGIDGAGIYCAGLGKKQKARITFASVQTLANSLDKFHNIQWIIIDEAHRVPKAGMGQYRQVLERFPDALLLGYTATPFRTGSGLLHEGEGRIFEDLIYEEPVAKLIKDGYLSNVINVAPVHNQIDVKGLTTSAGDYNQKQAQARAMDGVSLAVRDMIYNCQNRNHILVFAAGIEHAEKVVEILKRDAPGRVEMVTGKTAKGERDKIIADMRGGDIRWLVNVGVLTTGFNAPLIDCVVLMRPTKSVSLYIQMVGRGMRNASGKDNCLVLDYGQNIERLGPIDDVNPGKDSPWACTGCGAINSSESPNCWACKELKPVDGEPITKTCVKCGSLCPGRMRECYVCGHEFPVLTDIKDTAEGVKTILKGQRSPLVKYSVYRTTYSEHKGKDGKPNTMRVRYYVDPEMVQEPVSEFVSLDASSRAYPLGLAWLKKRYFGHYRPKTIAEAVGLSRDFDQACEIWVDESGKYKRVKKVEFAPF